jgi:hypothetical protein
MPVRSVCRITIADGVYYTINSHQAISYADAFAMAATQQQQGILVTDDPELIQLKNLISMEPLHRV